MWGYFTTAHGMLVNRIVAYDPSTQIWTALWGWLDGNVQAIAIDGSWNYVVGWYFTTASGLTVNNIAVYHPGTQTWATLWGWVSAGVATIVIDGSWNYVVWWQFETASGLTVNGIARYNPTTQIRTALWGWVDDGGGGGISVNTIAIDHSWNYVIWWSFWAVDGIESRQIARYNIATSSRESLSTGTYMNTVVNSIAIDAQGRYIVGWLFRSLVSGGDPEMSNLAIYDPVSQTRQSIGTPDSDVSSVAVDVSGHVMIAWWFSSVSGVNTVALAYYDPDTSSWYPMLSRADWSASAVLAIDDLWRFVFGWWFRNITTASGQNLFSPGIILYQNDIFTAPLMTCFDSIGVVFFSPNGFPDTMCYQKVSQSPLNPLRRAQDNTAIILQNINPDEVLRVNIPIKNLSQSLQNPQTWVIRYLGFSLGVPALAPSAVRQKSFYIKVFKKEEFVNQAEL
jgi:hypothetical protein